MSDAVPVNAAALRQLLVALNGGGHLIRELQVTRGPLFPDNPIDVVTNEFNAWVEKAEQEEKP